MTCDANRPLSAYTVPGPPTFCGPGTLPARPGDAQRPDLRRDGPNLYGDVLAVLAVLTADILGVDAVDELPLYVK